MAAASVCGDQEATTAQISPERDAVEQRTDADNLSGVGRQTEEGMDYESTQAQQGEKRKAVSPPEVSPECGAADTPVG